jgi:hypothetical protein
MKKGFLNKFQIRIKLLFEFKLSKLKILAFKIVLIIWDFKLTPDVFDISALLTKI